MHCLYPMLEYLVVKFCPKVAQNCHDKFDLKVSFSKSPEFSKYLGYFGRKICCPNISKIAKSGHTGHLNYTYASKKITAELIMNEIIRLILFLLTKSGNPFYILTSFIFNVHSLFQCRLYFHEAIQRSFNFFMRQRIAVQLQFN